MSEELEETLTLVNLKNGAAVERWDDELQKILANIADPNTEAKAKRAITLKVTFHPTEDRDVASVIIESKSDLAPFKAVGGQVYFGKVGGNLIAAGYDPRQMALFKQPKPAEFPAAAEGEGGEE